MKNDNKPLRNWLSKSLNVDDQISEIINLINNNKGDVSSLIIKVEKLFDSLKKNIIKEIEKL